MQMATGILVNGSSRSPTLQPLRSGLSQYLTVYEFKHGHVMEIRKLHGTCKWGDALECSAQVPMLVGSGVWMLLSTAYCVWYAWYLFKTHHQLKKKLYQRYRISHLLLQLQVRHRPTAYACTAVSLTEQSILQYLLPLESNFVEEGVLESSTTHSTPGTCSKHVLNKRSPCISLSHLPSPLTAADAICELSLLTLVEYCNLATLKCLQYPSVTQFSRGFLGSAETTHLLYLVPLHG
jgi:hypothetical protein